jgi:Glycosyl hydrolases family 43
MTSTSQRGPVTARRAVGVLAVTLGALALAASALGAPATSGPSGDATARSAVQEPEPYAGYAFVHMLGEGTATGEQVHFAVSEGNDPLHWIALNDHRPVLTSRLGEQGVRDPYVIRSPDGDRFYLIATDLRIFGSGPDPWDRAQRWGSRSIMVWESTDLVTWSEQRLVQVSPERAGNTWAPEAFYDHTTGKYVVFWASKIYDNDEHTGDPHQRMLYATTRDFRTFSEWRVWHDPGYSVIDSTVIEHDGTYYRFTKDERDNTPPCNQFIVEEKAASLTDLHWDFVAECIGQGDMIRGEGPIVFQSNTEQKWYLFIDEFGYRGYVPFESTDLDSGEWTYVDDIQWPGRPRHGGVISVTAMEQARLLATPPQECTRTFTGQVHGPLRVTAGVVCLDGATVTGPVRVADGATLVADGGRVVGSLTADGARIVALTDLAVTGRVTVRDTSGWVRLTDSRVVGPTRVDGTGGDVAPDLSRTRIVGSLACHDNQIAPVLDGTEVTGPRTGQCRSSSDLGSVFTVQHRR